MVVQPTSAPDGPHSWEQPTGPRATFRCCKCRAEVFVVANHGTHPGNALSRVAWKTCAEAMVRAVMES